MITPTKEQTTAFNALDKNGELENILGYKLTNNEIYIIKQDIIIAILHDGSITNHINRKGTK